MPEQKPLQKEYEFYLRIKPDLLKNSKGKFVVIKDQNVEGAFDTDSDAYKAGLSKFGNVPFLIIQVSEEDQNTRIPLLELGFTDANR
jgi:hypothetical protein